MVVVAVALGVYPFSLFGLAPTAIACTLVVVLSALVHRRRLSGMALDGDDVPV